MGLDEDRRLAETRATYDRIAGRYAARFLCSGPSPELDAFLRGLGAAGPSDPEGVVLDAGCGPGLDAADLAGGVRPVIGVDVSWGMLTEARRRAVVPLLHGDLLRLPLRSASVAGLWCANVLMHLPPEAAATAVAELARVARRGAPLFVSVTAGAGQERRDDGGGHRSFWNHERQPLIDTVTRAGFLVGVCRLDPSPNGHWLRLHATRA